MNRNGNKWATLPPLKPGIGIPGGGGGGDTSIIEQSLRNHIRDNSIHHTAEDIEKLSTKDIVFKMMEPLEVGIQHDTEFLYPYEGIINNINVSIPNANRISSNLLVDVQIFREGGWRLLDSMVLQSGQTVIDKAVLYPINNQRLRIIIIDGDMDTVQGITVIMKVKR